jgi:hypothetical protein
MNSDDLMFWLLQLKDNRFGYISEAVVLQMGKFYLYFGKKFSEEPYSSSTIHVWIGKAIYRKINLDIEVNL